MEFSKRIFFGIHLVSLLSCYACVGHAATTQKNSSTTPLQLTSEPKKSFYIGLLYIQPSSDNLKYATFVSGNQPYHQSWHYQEINPTYHPAFELGFTYAIPQSIYDTAGNWTHLNSTDKDSKQANTSTATATIEFVGPPYEMSPPVFGIKSVNSKVNFEFDNLLFNVGRSFQLSSNVSARLYGGIDILNLDQTITTIFGDYAGAEPTPYSYPLPPDPSFSFKTKNTSNYLGAGPALGMNFRYTMSSGFGILADFLGLLTAGTMKTKDEFTSTSARLTSIGIGTSHQEISSPNTAQVVLGGDAKLGVFYNFQSPKVSNFTVEAGYRIATYTNAISMIMPGTLVQPGTVVTTPEFSTGTMAIVSTNSQNGPFSFNGFFLNVKVDLA